MSDAFVSELDRHTGTRVVGTVDLANVDVPQGVAEALESKTTWTIGQALRRSPTFEADSCTRRSLSLRSKATAVNASEAVMREVSFLSFERAGVAAAGVA